LRRITEGAQRILSFARELVQYAKPSGDQVVAVSLNGVVRQSLSLCEHLFELSGVRLHCSFAEELPMVYAVPGQLEQVIINLVTNQRGGNGRGRNASSRCWYVGHRSRRQWTGNSAG
jgi:C4-dicarboxylate-specific signal transduction histidine kinase